MNQNQNFQYGAVDLAKFLCALLIVTAHYVTENAEGRINIILDYGVSIYIIVVPFFFVCSGYFLFKKILHNQENEKKIIKMYLQQILLMYCGWSCIYIFFKILTWIRFGTSIEIIQKYILNSVFYSTYKTIWFLPALCIGVLLTYYFYTKWGIKKTLVIAILFYILGSLGVSYSFIFENTPIVKLLEGYNYIFVSTRNGFFNGFPFITIGLLIANKEYSSENRTSILKSLSLSVLFGVLFVIEAFVLKFRFQTINVNTLLFLLPFVYYFLKLCLGVTIRSGSFFKWMRKMSTTMFLCQRIFLTAIPELFPNCFFSKILEGNPYVGLLYIVCSTLFMSEIILLLAKKSKLVASIC